MERKNHNACMKSDLAHAKSIEPPTLTTMPTLVASISTRAPLTGRARSRGGSESPRLSRCQPRARLVTMLRNPLAEGSNSWYWPPKKRPRLSVVLNTYGTKLRIAYAQTSLTAKEHAEGRMGSGCSGALSKRMSFPLIKKREVG